MKLSEQLRRDHDSGDFGKALEGYAERAERLEMQAAELAAEQAKNVELRGWVLNNSQHTDTCNVLCLDDEGRHLPCDCGLSEVLATPSDTSALEAIVKKAGEVMRERALDPHLTRITQGSEMVIADAICALPAVTLEDLE